jgi:23S rRNA (guanosine2251-2'-O)-methyltransferase
LLTEPLVLVVGGEGKGLSRLVLERADVRVRIPMGGRLGSLNAAVAGAIALFEVHRKRTSRVR